MGDLFLRIANCGLPVERRRQNIPVILSLIMVILKGIYTIYCWTLLILLGFWAFLWALIVSVIRGKKGIAAIVMGYKIFTKCWCFCIGIRIKLKGKHIRDKAEPCIIVGNHGSNLDMMTAP